MYSNVRPYKILQKVKANENNSKEKPNEEKKNYDNHKKYEDDRRYKYNKHVNNYKTKNNKTYTINNNYEKSSNNVVLKKTGKDMLISLLKKDQMCVKKKKIVIRNLPPTLNENNFFDSFSNNLKDELDYYYYVNGSIGKNSSDDITHSRIYLSFKDYMKTEEFIKTQDGKYFYDTNGIKYKANVTFAPNQTIIHKNRTDNRNNTLDTDPYFLKCCEEMNNPVEPPKNDIDYHDIINVVRENDDIISPIVIDLRKKLKNSKVK
ncbi:regulator of nonsense transcripts 3B, putative [Plasmodium chabaudi adami]|uniref:Regulator of nonsense transcripts 3B, putative n=1 Tax=Plasmodium chabaudi adami TaxID=5826 RepID=A0A1D3LM68_PLACE|nr:regulator of nonsense transcripts 3B, putative [Plasmodium chabaudi adami]